MSVSFNVRFKTDNEYTQAERNRGKLTVNSHDIPKPYLQACRANQSKSHEATPCPSVN
jgi:hypothetical protein